MDRDKIYIIQAKYYTTSTLNMHDIIWDLYYQYLHFIRVIIVRLEMNLWNIRR